MNALLSGLAGQGLLLDDDKHYLISIDAPDEIKPVAEMGFFPFFNDRDTLTFLENVTPAEALRELQLLYRQQEALDLALMLFDDDLSVELRREAATELDELLNNEAVQAYLKAILYAKPLPPSADKTGALKTAEEAKTVLVLPFLKILIERQKQIALVRRSWDTLPMDLFKAEAPQSKVHAIAIENQLFLKLVESLVLEQLDQFERDALDTLKSVKNHERIVNCWIGNLREEPKIDAAKISKINVQKIVIAMKSKPSLFGQEFSQWYTQQPDFHRDQIRFAPKSVISKLPDRLTA